MQKEKLALLVPYRDRAAHLEEFLKYVPEYINKQNIEFIIVICEQGDNQRFNRGKVLNCGVDYLMKNNIGFSYVCFHDVDNIPVDKVDYSYSDVPVHIATEIQQFGWALPYPNFYSIANILTKENLVKTNSYPSIFGYGMDDDSLLFRVKYVGYELIRREGKFRSLPHYNARNNYPEYNDNLKIMTDEMEGKTSPMDNGLNNVSYTVLDEKIEGNIYHIKFNL